ncbi:MAG: hypothetical protein K5774_06130, partial [Clostridia bacterium]|nr:hypothetical protein [Clostridia bacterium]
MPNYIIFLPPCQRSKHQNKIILPRDIIISGNVVFFFINERMAVICLSSRITNQLSTTPGPGAAASLPVRACAR